MSKRSLTIASNVLEDKTLTPSQKLILSYISQNQNSYLLNIAKGIGTRRSLIENEIKQLVEQNRLFVSNGTGRNKYSTIKGLGFKGSPTEQKATCSLPKVNYLTTNNNINKSKGLNNSLTLTYGSGELAIQAIEYWSKNGGIKHRMGSAIYEQSVELLIKLFEGTAFRSVPDETIPLPKINKRKRFTMEDWMSAIDYFNLSLTDPKYKPYNKDKAKKWRKKLTLPVFIYNHFGREGQNRSMFLRYVNGAELLHQEKAIYPELARAITNAFNKIALQLRPNQAHIVSIANKLPLLAKKHKWKWVSKGDAAQVFVDFIMYHFGELRFNPNFMSAPWFTYEFEKYLDRQGLITLYE